MPYAFRFGSLSSRGTTDPKEQDAEIPRYQTGVPCNNATDAPKIAPWKHHGQEHPRVACA